MDGLRLRFVFYSLPLTHRQCMFDDCVVLLLFYFVVCSASRFLHYYLLVTHISRPNYFRNFPSKLISIYEINGGTGPMVPGINTAH
jgi:hypothetical protein